MKAEALAEAEAKLSNSFSDRSLTSFDALKIYYGPYIGRTYWTEGWYYLTFKPLDIPYAEDRQWFEIKAIKKYYDKFRPLAKMMWLTRETASAKIHINLLIYSSSDLMKFNDKILYHKVKVYCTKLPYTDRYKVFDYIFKEAKTREFYYSLDYKFFDKEEKISTPDRI